MSVELNAARLRRIATFLDLLTEATAETGVSATYYGEAGICIDDETFRMNYDSTAGTYAIEDR